MSNHDPKNKDCDRWQVDENGNWIDELSQDCTCKPDSQPATSHPNYPHEEIQELVDERDRLRGLFAELQEGCGSTVCKVKRPVIGTNGPCRCAERLRAAELGEDNE